MFIYLLVKNKGNLCRICCSFPKKAAYVANTQTFTINVYRGLSPDGSTHVGPVDSPAAINCYLIPSSAVLGSDFTGTNSSVTFDAGVTVSPVNISILVPTSAGKSFSIVLDSASGNVFLADPWSAFVTINATRGSIGWQPERVTVIDVISPGRLTLVRVGGIYGIVTATWSLVLNGSADGKRVVGFSNNTGDVVLGDGVASATITLTLATADDSSPRPVQLCQLRLTSAVGGTIVRNQDASVTPMVLVVVADSGAAYGVFNFDTRNCSLVTVGKRL